MSDTPDEFRRRLEQPEWAKIPERTRRSLYLYYAHRCQPGSALSAVLAKKFDAIVMVDDEVYAALRDIYRLLLNYAWSGLWGRQIDVVYWVDGKTERPEHWPEDAVSRLGQTAG